MPEENRYGSSKERVNLTKSLIAQRNLFAPVENETPERISQALSSLLILRLDRERISCIPNLQGLEQIHSMYLQQNQIEKIENLSCFPNLKFLSLAGNRISRVENLQALPKLQFLDLSHNHIESLDADELPQSLLVLDLTGNKCTNQNSYRESVLAALPHLIDLDAQHIPIQKTPVQDREQEEESSEDSDEDIPELSQPLSAEKDFFDDLRNEFTGRSARRRRDALSEHEARLEELKERQNRRQLLLTAGSQAPSSPDLQTQILQAPVPQNECHGASSPCLKTANSVYREELSMQKGKSEIRSQTQGKTLKAEGPGIVKCVRKAKK